MIIFVNGPFGVGKTTVVAELADCLPDSLIVDPEKMGHLIWGQLPTTLRHEEFELEPVWPPVTRCLIAEVHRTYSRTTLVPMTIARESVFDEIVGRLRADGHDARHFTLLASAATIRERLRRRGERPDKWGELSWEGEQVERCLLSLMRPSFATHLDTEGTTPEETATTIMRATGLTEVASSTTIS